jgi:glycosyltransferase involved in cell wall biosynthesis
VFARNGRKLRIVGEGPEYRRLKQDATANIEFCGRVTDEELRELYARCMAFVMPAEEDFGIAAVEAMASGKPVVGFARGGALETVPRSAPIGGILYSEPGEAGLREALNGLDHILPRIDERALRAWTQRFSDEEFRRRMSAALIAQPSCKLEVEEDTVSRKSRTAISIRRTRALLRQFICRTRPHFAR